MYPFPLSTQVLCLICSLITLSVPQLSSLPQSPTVPDINTSAHCGATFTRICQITTCLFYYGGNDFSPDDDDHGLHHPEQHGNCIHQDLLLSRPLDTLSTIGWIKCCQLCPHVFLTTDSLHHYHSTYGTFQCTLPPPTSHLDADTHKQLYSLCPPSLGNTLTSLLSSSPMQTH